MQTLLPRLPCAAQAHTAAPPAGDGFAQFGGGGARVEAHGKIAAAAAARVGDPRVRVKRGWGAAGSRVKLHRIGPQVLHDGGLGQARMAETRRRTPQTGRSPLQPGRRTAFHSGRTGGANISLCTAAACPLIAARCKKPIWHKRSSCAAMICSNSSGGQ